MKKKKIYFLMLTATLFLSQSVTVLAVTESDVEAVGKDTAAGNVFIWFLCAIAFLKISQKIDSFLSSLGINVGQQDTFIVILQTCEYLVRMSIQQSYKSHPFLFVILETNHVGFQYSWACFYYRRRFARRKSFFLIRFG